MPKTYHRHCDFCGEYYSGRGKRFCSAGCLQASYNAEETHQTETFGVSTGKDGVSVAFLKSERVVTFTDLVRACEIDLERFEILHVEHNKWEMGYTNRNKEPGHYPLFQVKARFKPRQPLADMERMLAELIQKADEHSPTCYDELLREKTWEDVATGDAHCMEINITDHHLGKLAWGLETQGENYDVAIARRLFLWAVDDLVRKAGNFRIDRFVFPLGNDLFHADRLTSYGSGGQTTAGTIVDVDTRRKKLIRIVQEMCIDAIDYLRQMAPVDVIIVPGNHDEDTAFTLGEYLSAWYRLDPEVRIDNGPSDRKYYEYGLNMLGFTHGKKEGMKRLPMLMPLEQPEMWARTKFREWHVGDKHRLLVRDVISATDDEGVRIRILPSLAASDAWHSGKGFKGAVRAAEAFLWNHQTGFGALFSANARSEEDL